MWTEYGNGCDDMRVNMKKLDYKWVILGICFLMEFICLGFCSSNVGLYTVAVTEALEIKRSLYSLNTSIRYVTQVITALSFGSMINRFGAKKMVCAGLLSLGGSVLVRGVATQLYHLYIAAMMWGFGIVFSGGTMASTIVRRWFNKDIGKYTGIVMSANGIGGAIAAQIISPIINNGEVFGYRKAYLLSAGITLLATLVVMLFLREWPAGGPTIPNLDGKKKSRAAVWSGLDYSAIKKKPYFYLTAVLVCLTGISLQSIGSITIVYMTDIGISPEFIAISATVSSLVLTVAKILVGHIYDKRGIGMALFLCQICALVAFLLKALLTNSVQGMVFAMIATVFSTIALPVETVIIPLLSMDMFGSTAYNKVLGVMMAMNSLGLCVGAPLGDFYYDVFGTYRPCFWFFAGLMLAVIISFRFVLRAANRDKAKLLAEENV